MLNTVISNLQFLTKRYALNSNLMLIKEKR